MVISDVCFYKVKIIKKKKWQIAPRMIKLVVQLLRTDCHKISFIKGPTAQPLIVCGKKVSKKKAKELRKNKEINLITKQRGTEMITEKKAHSLFLNFNFNFTLK